MGVLHLWKVPTGRALLKLKKKNYPFNSAEISPNEETILGGSNDGKVHLWDIKTGQKLKTFQTPSGNTIFPIISVQFSPDGNTILSGAEDGTVRLWDIKTGKLRILLSCMKVLSTF
ncbi:hypothetical protein H0W26_02175 [Candidatus Dependentiae bacterium]|nr:hypothetical protein [Candidatus Dependentiae bacterium]